MGRVPGALSHQADAAIATLDAGEREVARRILLSLIWLGEGLGRLTGRRVRRAELVEQSADARESERVLQRLADQRLIVIDTDRESSVVTLVHDTLPVHWDLLKRWVQEDREFLLWRERLRPDVEQYVKNPDRDLLSAARRSLKPRPGSTSAAAISPATRPNSSGRAFACERDEDGYAAGPWRLERSRSSRCCWKGGSRGRRRGGRDRAGSSRAPSSSFRWTRS